MAKYLIRLVLMGSRVVAKAFARAVEQEIAANKEAARRVGGGAAGARHVAANAKTGITLDEALRILNVEKPNETEAIKRNYEYLMQANDRSKGGSFYLQSKVVRAKERIDEELKILSSKQRTTSSSDRATKEGGSNVS